jgi:hypothetical protein
MVRYGFGLTHPTKRLARTRPSGPASNTMTWLTKLHPSIQSGKASAQTDDRHPAHELNTHLLLAALQHFHHQSKTAVN